MDYCLELLDTAYGVNVCGAKLTPEGCPNNGLHIKKGNSK